MHRYLASAAAALIPGSDCGFSLSSLREMEVVAHSDLHQNNKQGGQHEGPMASFEIIAVLTDGRGLLF